jgi:hypothetical protein
MPTIDRRRKREIVMSMKDHWAIREHRLDSDRRCEEIEWTLNAIAGAIFTGRLPPDDAFAWGRIAAREAALLGAARVGAAAVDGSMA